MKNRVTTILLVLFFGGLAGLWLADYARIPTRRDLDRQKGRVLVGLIDTRPDDVRKIEVTGGATSLTFERRDGNRWQMTSPIDVAADPSKVENLAFNLKELTRKPETDVLEGDPATFGLAHPSRTVKVWGLKTDEPLATLELGKTSLSRRYVRSGGSTGIEVVDEPRLAILDLPVIDWRDRELFRVPSFEVDAVKVTGKDRSLTVRRDSDAWRITDPIRAIADETKVDGLIADLGSIKITDIAQFVLDGASNADLHRFGLMSPSLTVEVDAGRVDSRRLPQVVHVGKSVEGNNKRVYVRRGDEREVIAVDARVFNALGINPNSYRSPKVADIKPGRVTRLQFKLAGKEFEIRRVGRDWAIDSPEPALADRDAIQKFLKGLDGLQTTFYLKPEAEPNAGLDHPSIVVKVWQAADNRSRSTESQDELALTLKVGRKDAERKVYLAQVEGDRSILALPDSTGDFLPRSSLAFRDRLVLAVATPQIERLVFAGSGRRTTLQAPVLKLDAFNNAANGWWMVEPIPGLADNESVAKLLKLLAALRVESFVAESAEDLSPFGLQAPILTLTWETPSKFSMTKSSPKRLEEHRLSLGALVPGRGGSRFAKIEGQPTIMTLSAEAIAIIDAEWRDRHVLTFDPAQVRRLHLSWPDGKFDLIRAANSPAWTLAGPIDAPDFDPATADALLKAASRLTTGRFAQYTGEFPTTYGLNPPRFAVRIEFADGTAPRTLRIGAKAGDGQVFATTTPEPNGPAFLVADAPFLSWLREPRRRGDLPDNVFAPE